MEKDASDGALSDLKVFLGIIVSANRLLHKDGPECFWTTWRRVRRISLPQRLP
jgi:hypothetical protein